MASGAAKAALFDAFASVAQALGSGRRAEIVDVLAQGERSVDEIAGEIAQSVANTSQHLQVLARAGLVRSRREGTRVFYRLASDRVGDLWAAVRDVAVRHVAEVSVLADEYLGERDGSSSSRRTSSSSGWRAATWSCSTCARSRVPGRSHRRRPLGAAGGARRDSRRSCRGGARSSPTAAARTASTPTTPSGCCASVG